MTSEAKILGLPSYHNAFVGRAHNVRAIGALLRDEHTRLISLLGPGGIGKTRLAVQVSEQMASSFQEGICFVGLDMVNEAEQVPLYIGGRLGLTVRFAHQWVDEIIDYLRDKCFLLILDNLEQVLEAVDDIARILSACPRLKVLATSREVLGLSYEIEYPLDSLSRPNRWLFPSPDELRKFAAIDLFVQTARISVPTFELTEQNAPAVVEICQELEGMPLPIELAAARVKLFDPAQMLEQLKRSKGLLRTRARDVVPRHQTIGNTIRWSYDLLDAAEQRFFQQLSLFRGGFTPSALSQIYPSCNPLDQIESFLNKSLIRKEAGGTEPRFRMLKLIRDFGLDLLHTHPSASDDYERFACYFYRFITDAHAERNTTDPAEWIGKIEAEYENLTLALDWLVEHRPPAAAALGACFWQFHLNRGFLREGLAMVERLLQLPEVDRELKGRLLAGAGALSQNLGNYPAAKEFFNESLSVWQALNNEREASRALSHTAWAEWRVGNYQASIAYSQKALRLSEQLEDAIAQAKALNNLAWVYFYQGRYDEGQELQRKVLHIHTQAQNFRGITFARSNLGWVLLYAGQMQEAERLIRRGIEGFKELKDRQLIAFSNFIWADFLFENRERTAAKEVLLEHCLPEFSSIGDLWGVAVSRQRLGRIALLDNEYAEASSYLQRSAELFRQSQDQYGCSMVKLWLAKLARRNGVGQEPLTLLRECLELARPMEVYPLLRDAYYELGQYYLAREKPSPAAAYFGVAVHFGAQCGSHSVDRLLEELAPHRELITQQLRDPELEKRLNRFPLPFTVDALAGQWETATGSEASQSAIATESSSSEPASPFIRKVRRVVLDRLHDPDFSVRDLCDEVHLSHSQVHRKLKSLRGQSATQFIRQLRMERAKELLEDPDLSVTAIAIEVGYRDPDYFYRVFKQAYQTTPGAFRKGQSEK